MTKNGSVHRHVNEIIKRMKLYYADTAPQSCLVMGLGGAMIPKKLNEMFPSILVTVIEADEAVIEAQKLHFPVEPMKVVHASAETFPHEGPAETFDAILVDVFDDGAEFAFIRSSEWILSVVKLLNPKGFLAFNVIGKSAYTGLLKTLKLPAFQSVSHERRGQWVCVYGFIKDSHGLN
jgi:spermidine synthase